MPKQLSKQKSGSFRSGVNSLPQNLQFKIFTNSQGSNDIL